MLLDPPDPSTDVDAGYVETAFQRLAALKEQYMRTKQRMEIAAMASAIGVTGRVFATETTHVKTTDAATTPLGQTPETAGVGSNNKTEGENFDAWISKHATAHNGRITREEFMNQMSLRWDTLDAQRSGYMTADQVRRISMSSENGR